MSENSKKSVTIYGSCVFKITKNSRNCQIKDFTNMVESMISSFREWEWNREIFDLILLVLCFCCICDGFFNLVNFQASLLML